MSLILAVVVIGLVGCASAGGHPTNSGLPTGSRGEGPAFSGPYAAEFAEAYRTAKSDAVRRMLAKGTVTEQDRATAWETYRSCMAAAGFTAVEKDDHVEYGPASGTLDQSKGNSADTRCDEEASFGRINGLYKSLTKYPQGEDQRKAMFVECLRRAKAVQPGYSVEDLMRDSKPGGAWDPNKYMDRESSEDPLPGRFKDYQRCSSDPSQ